MLCIMSPHLKLFAHCAILCVGGCKANFKVHKGHTLHMYPCIINQGKGEITIDTCVKDMIVYCGLNSDLSAYTCFISAYTPAVCHTNVMLALKFKGHSTFLPGEKPPFVPVLVY